MEHFSSYLDPNPGWVLDGDGADPNIDSDSQPPDTEVVGKHCILELYECDPCKLNDEAFIRTILTSAAKLAGATLLNLITHHFEPHGVTGLALLAESHISIHTWPEIGYAAVDVFTCGDHTMPERATDFISKELFAQRNSLRSFQREAPFNIRNVSRTPKQIDHNISL